MPGDALIWLLAGVGLGVGLSMLILAVVAMSDRRQIRRASVIAEVKPVAEAAQMLAKPVVAQPVAAKPVAAKAVVQAAAMVAPVAANTVAPKPVVAPIATPAAVPVTVPAPAPAPTPEGVEAVPVTAAPVAKSKPRDMSVEALFAEAFGAAELPKAAEPGKAK